MQGILGLNYVGGVGLSQQRGGSSQPEVTPPPPDFVQMRAYNIRVPFGYGLSNGSDGFATDPYALGGSGSWGTSVPPTLIDSLVTAGANAVRLIIDPGPLMAASGGQRSAYYVRFDEAIQDLLDAGLKVVVNLHPKVESVTDPAGYGFQDVTDGLSGPKWTRYKSEAALLGAHLLSEFDRENVLFEPHNEPDDMSGTTWRDYMLSLHAAVRAAAPGLTIVVTPENYADASALAAFAPIDDPNTLYSFHHYTPNVFTFQTQLGATEVSRLKFPPVEADRAAAIAAAPGSTSALEVYFDTPQDIQHLSPAFDAVASWASTNSVSPERIFMGEFGSWGDYSSTVGADMTSREHYYRAIRLEAEANGFSWAAFNLISPGDGFGLTSSNVLIPRLTDALHGEIGPGTTDGAVAGTPGSLPTALSNDGSATCRVVSVGVEDGIPYFDYEISGGYANLIFPNGYGGLPIVGGGLYEVSAYFHFLSGTFEYAKFSVIKFSPTDQGDGPQFEGTFGGVTKLRHGFRRYLYTAPSSGDGNAMLAMTPTGSGTAVVRIGAPTLRRLD